MIKLDVYQVAAFTDRQFGGNPAAVVPLNSWIDDSLMQNIAAEINLSETAFVLPGARTDTYAIRWFTPKAEVPLCGHATLASAFVLRESLGNASFPITFESASGPLQVDFVGGLYVLDFPVNVPQAVSAPAGMDTWLGCDVGECLLADGFYLVVLPTEQQVAGFAPDLASLGKNVEHGVIVTAPGDNVDFVSRFFAPAIGIDEDPVTGSAHCVLVPYWSQRLDKKVMQAKQVSARVGDVGCELCDDRVKISGSAVAFSSGLITVPGNAWKSGNGMRTDAMTIGNEPAAATES